MLLTNTFAELKNSLEALNSKIDEADERITVLVDKLFEITQSVEKKKNEKIKIAYKTYKINEDQSRNI